MHIAAIMPFRGNPSTLAWVLEGFAMQQLASDQSLEVRLYGDGVALPPLPSDCNRIHFTAMEGPHVGVAEAKNVLLRGRPADIVLIVNADTRPAPNFVQGHVQRLLSLPSKMMVLGAAPYEPSPHPTVFDLLKEETPMIFFYNHLQAGERYDYRHVWTLNLSVRYTDLAQLHFFNPAFRPWGFEDLDLGFRLMGAGKNVYYDPALQVTHRHPMVLDDYLQREELLGAMAPVLYEVNPAAFQALYGNSFENMTAECAQYVKMDRTSHAWVYKRFKEWCELPAQSLGDNDARQRLLMTIYQMHIPLKRLAFRLGFLWGIDLRGDAQWLNRQPRNQWREVLGL